MDYKDINFNIYYRAGLRSSWKACRGGTTSSE